MKINEKRLAEASPLANMITCGAAKFYLPGIR
jgi:hypothetical protein